VQLKWQPPPSQEASQVAPPPQRNWQLPALQPALQ
jgi:hypothetical protein